jgi:multidrug resistance efflux pump
MVWSVYHGIIDSRNSLGIMSQLSGPATVVELAPDGSSVKDGEVIVRFDTTPWERDFVRAERDNALARAEFESLSSAKLPMELSDLESRFLDAQRRLADEKQALTDSLELVKEGLLPEHDTKQQEFRVQAAQSAADSLKQTIELTKKYIHPSAMERTRATLTASENELSLLRNQISNCVIRAPAGRVVVYKPIAVNGEYRTVRIGDTVFKNQPFITLPDMSNLIVQCDVPESELMKIAAGSTAIVRPMAFPELNLKSTVESVGAMAQTIAGRPDAVKYFSVMVRIEENDPRLRSGMSALVRILSCDLPDAVIAPRTAIWWEDGKAHCNVVTPGGRINKKTIRTGSANETHFEILEGLNPGEDVVAQ